MWASRNASHRLWVTSTQHSLATSWAKSSARVWTIASACRAGPGRAELGWAWELRLCLTLNSWPASDRASSRVLSQTVSVTVRL